MQLKKLELKGFKSFAEKTTLDFNDGITAVVGPNGSGKSNIIEAIRWVMGEQSAKSMRGGRMYDVIFSGSSSRKAINIAEATLILDNSDGFLPIDFEEVSVTRRITRSGDSEYLINKQSCRLKDIVDLFMDSGLGRESFSFISQGKVEAVFNSKPEDRRAIFEEAAGVFKYKVRKKKAEQKLNDTQENLDRVQDILYELNGQIEPLREQSDIAKSYLEQKEELTDLDIGLSVMRIKELTQQVDSKKRELENTSNELTETERFISKNQTELSKAKGHLNELEQKREAVNRELLNTVQESERAEAALNLYTEKEKHKKVFLDEKEESIKKQEHQKVDLENRLKEANELLTDQTKEVASLSEQVANKKNQKNHLGENKDEIIEDMRASYIELMQQQTSLKNEQTYLKKEIEKQSLQVDKLFQNITQSTNEKENTEKEIINKKRHSSSIKKEIDDLLTQFQTNKDTLTEHEDTNEIKQKRLEETNSELQQARAKQRSLTEMQENYAGYFAGVKTVMQQKEQLNGIVGTVADLIEVPKQYMQAIDTVLASNSQFIVVENETAGREAINFLKKKQAGRATFLPLTSIKPRSISPKLKKKAKTVKGFVGIGSELIEFDQQVSNVIQNLLGNTIIADSLKAANAIAKAVGYRIRIVSLDGDVMNAGGSMTGGGGKRSSNTHLFSQKKELKELDIFIEETERTVALREQELKENKEKTDDLSAQLEDIRLSGEEKRLEEKQLQSELDAIEESNKRLNREQKATEFEWNEVKKELKANQERLIQVEEEQKTIEDQVTKQKQDMNQLSNQKETVETQKAQVEEEIAELQDQLSDSREKQVAIKTQLENGENQLKQVVQTIQTLEEDIQGFISGEKVQSKEELEEEITSLKTRYTDLKNKEKQLKEQQETFEAEQEKFETSLKQNEGRKQYLIEEKSTIEVELSRADVTIDHLLDYLVEEYHMSYEEARLQPSLTVEMSEAKKKVKLLKKGIQELGPVNVQAIEDFERVNERWAFLSNQQNDLLEAKTQLYNTMDEMDYEVKQRFKETFDHIQRQFSIVFPQMFGGGQAELKLTDPNDLLNSGIEIIAQPPGKKLSSIRLLSGGERALTAISLLFSIIQVRPIPFCILDEAEAALDEANVTRFGKYLRRFDIDTQFIVITHRKGTMEEADSLYGVTMQEKGVSKLVSVRLQDMEETEEVS